MPRTVLSVKFSHGFQQCGNDRGSLRFALRHVVARDFLLIRFQRIFLLSQCIWHWDFWILGAFGLVRRPRGQIVARAWAL